VPGYCAAASGYRLALEDVADHVAQSPWEQEVVVEGDVVAADEPGRVQVDFRNCWSS